MIVMSDIVWVDGQDVIGIDAEETDGFWFNLLDHLPIQQCKDGDVRLHRDGYPHWRITGQSAKAIREKMTKIHLGKAIMAGRLDKVPL